MLSPLYELGVKRDGCWFCPNASKKEREILKNKYPKLAQKCYEMIDMCEFDIKKARVRNNWVKDYYETKGEM